MRAFQGSVSLFAFWLVITGSAATADLVTGLVFSVILGHIAARWLWAADTPLLTVRQAARAFLYIPHLLISIVKSALQVAEVVLDPRIPLDPVVLRHRTALKRTVSRVAYANSITMTPGTITIDLEDGSFLIHSLDERFAADIANGDLERRVARVFEE